MSLADLDKAIGFQGGSPNKAAPIPKPKGGLLSSFFPAIGSIVGGIAGIPLGPAGIIGGSALGGGIGEFGRQKFSGVQDVNQWDIAKEGALSGAFSAAGLGLGKLVGALKGGKAAAEGAQGLKASSVAQKAPGMVKEKIAQTYLKMSPGQYKAAAELGLDPNQLLVKHLGRLPTKGAPAFDQLIGKVGKGTTGLFDDQLKSDEQIIQSVLKRAGGTQKISPDVLLKSLGDELEKIKYSTDSGRVTQLKEIMTQLAKTYKNGITPQQALKIVRAANEKFGKAIIEESAGSVYSSADKTIANALRETLRKMYPEVGEALQNQHELLVLKPLVESARAGTRSGAVTKGVSIFNPAGLAERAIGSPQTGGRILSGNIPTSIPKPGMKAGIAASQTIPRLATGVPGGVQGPTEALPQPTNPSQNVPGTSSIPQPQSLLSGEEAAKLILNNPKYASAIETAYKLSAGGGEKPLTAQQQKDKSNAESGLRAVYALENTLQQDPLAPYKAAIPGSPGARIFSTARKEAGDVLTRLRTGAALNDDEMVFYQQQLPQPFDSAETIQYKLSIFKDLFNRFISPTGAGGVSGSDFPAQAAQ